MKVAVHAAGGENVVRDATPAEEAVILARWSGKATAPRTGIVFVGDSNTTTTYVPTESNYAYRLAFALARPYQNSAVSGQRAAGIVTNIQSQVFAYNPVNVVVMIGTNDAAAAAADGSPTQTVVDAYIGSVRSFISQVNEGGARLIVLSPPLSQSAEANAYLTAMRDALHELCFEQTTQFLDVLGKMQFYGTLGGNYLEDWFIPSPLDDYHLSATGHAYIFDLLMKSQIRT